MLSPLSTIPRTRRWLLAGLVACIMAISVAGRFWFVFPGRPAAVPINNLEPWSIEIIPGIHLLGFLQPAAAYAVETSEGLVLIDTGLDSFADSVIRQLDHQQLHWTNLRAMLLTHVHADHSGGARFLQESTKAKVYAGRADAAFLPQVPRAKP